MQLEAIFPPLMKLGRPCGVEEWVLLSLHPPATLNQDSRTPPTPLFPLHFPENMPGYIFTPDPIKFSELERLTQRQQAGKHQIPYFRRVTDIIIHFSTASGRIRLDSTENIENGIQTENDINTLNCCGGEWWL